jgi:U3 small nucleolar RNA-associated protein 12
MVRSYNRHGAVEAFGVIASNTSNSIFDGKVAYVPACEDVLVCRCKVLIE